MEKIRHYRLEHKPGRTCGMCRVYMAHLADVKSVVVEALDEESDGFWGELVVVSQQQRQETDRDLLELPRPVEEDRAGVYRRS